MHMRGAFPCVEIYCGQIETWPRTCQKETANDSWRSANGQMHYYRYLLLNQNSGQRFVALIEEDVLRKTMTLTLKH